MFSIQLISRRNSIRNRVLPVAAIAVVLAYLAVTATVALTDGREVISADPAEARSGEDVTITGDDYIPGEEVEFSCIWVRRDP